MSGPKPQLLRRLLASHVGIALVVATLSACVVWAVFYLSEDRAYAALMGAVTSEGSDDTGRIESWLETELPPELAEFVQGRADGMYETEEQGAERHVGIVTPDSGPPRRVVVMTMPEGAQDQWLATGLALAIVAIGVAGVAVGYRIARGIVAPLGQLAEFLRARAPIAERSDLARFFDDDEVGFVAQRIDEFLNAAGSALERERQFITDASHELRNPLAVLSGAIELALSDGAPDSESSLRRLERMERATVRMQHAVDCLLWMSRREAELRSRTSRSLHAGVVELLREIEPELAPGVRLELRSAPSDQDQPERRPISWASGDPDTDDENSAASNSNYAGPSGPPEVWLLILGNLLDNAVRHTDSGSICVEVSPERISVQDTGGGIPPELQHAISDAWVQGPNSRGFGLGLSIVRRLARRLEWELEICSRPGEGTCVSLQPDRARTGARFASAQP